MSEIHAGSTRLDAIILSVVVLTIAGALVINHIAEKDRQVRRECQSKAGIEASSRGYVICK